MCGRYSITIDRTTIEYHFNAKFATGQQEFHPTYNAVMSQLLPIITTYASTTITMARWGFIPADFHYPNMRPQNNARLEIAATKPSFRKAFAGQHALIITVANFADKFTTKELTFDRATGIDLTLSHELCIGQTCVTEDQLKAMLAASAAASAPTHADGTGAPAAPPASGDASTTSPITFDTLKVNANKPAEWQQGTPWQDNLGALFTHEGIAETIYSTSTVDVSVSGTTTIDYWAHVPGANWLRATRVVVVGSAANDNVAASVPEASNDNSPLDELPATGTE